MKDLLIQLNQEQNEELDFIYQALIPEIKEEIVCKDCKNSDYLIFTSGYWYCRKCTGDEVEKIPVIEKIDRKTLSTRIHLILAGLLDEPNRFTRGNLIVKAMELVKEME